jgi:hypothetical protein
VSARAWIAGALLFCACSPGPPLVLGRLPEPDEDAGSDEGSDEPCQDADDCQGEARPFCDYELERCVECTRDRQCADDEYCGSRSGRCIKRSSP